ncbi:MAG: peptidoglycan DD-metalloendopeptidase family protein [Lachnospira sp.]|nr:peptidoglycan DD-metalloendopeptidase family protein [Lachnospira sp.]
MKKSLIKRAVSLLLCVSMVLALTVVPYNNIFSGKLMQAYAVTDAEIQDAKDKQAAIEAERKRVQNQINSLKSQAANTEAYLATLDKKMLEIGEEIYKLGQDIAAKEVKIEETKTELSEAEKVRDHQYEMMKLRIKFMYEQNEQTYLSMFLESSSLADMLNKVEYVSKLSEYDRNMLEEYKATITRVAEAKIQLETELASLNESKTAAEVKQSGFEVAAKEKETQLAKLNSELAQLANKETELGNMSAEAEAAFKALEEKKRKEEEEANKNNGGSSAGTITNPYESGFIWPTISKRITSRYGKRGSSFHYGVDIGAVTPGKWGDPIYVVADGEISSTYYDENGGGNMIFVYHGGGLYTVYMHCWKFTATVGQKVKQGDKIALMGSTGRSTGAHLHFAVRINGGYVNPEPYIGIK